jgi:hypothetical protein
VSSSECGGGDKAKKKKKSSKKAKLKAIVDENTKEEMMYGEHTSPFALLHHQRSAPPPPVAEVAKHGIAVESLSDSDSDSSNDESSCDEYEGQMNALQAQLKAISDKIAILATKKRPKKSHKSKKAKNVVMLTSGGGSTANACFSSKSKSKSYAGNGGGRNLMDVFGGTGQAPQALSSIPIGKVEHRNQQFKNASATSSSKSIKSQNSMQQQMNSVNCGYYDMRQPDIGMLFTRNLFFSGANANFRMNKGTENQSSDGSQSKSIGPEISNPLIACGELFTLIKNM